MLWTHHTRTVTRFNSRTEPVYIENLEFGITNTSTEILVVINVIRLLKKLVDESTLAIFFLE